MARVSTINPGALRTRCQLQARTATQDAAGQPLETWTTFATVYADLRHISGLETVRADAIASTVRASARIRWRSDVNAGHRLLAESRTYNITAVLPEQTRRFVDLACEVVV